MLNILLLQNLISLRQELFNLRLKRENLACKRDIDNFVKKTNLGNKLKDAASNKNELNGLSKKVNTIATKELKKVLINKFRFLMEQNIFLQEYFKII